MVYHQFQTGSYYHVYNRGNNQENLFREERNYYYFLRLLQKHVNPYAEILAYCLLKNHFHLLIRICDDVEIKKTSQAFSNFFNAYAKAINKTYGRTGSLFQDRFSRRLIEDEFYLLQVITYIHRNPVHHKFAEDFTSYRFSSYQLFITQEPGFVAKDHVLELFGDLENFLEAHGKDFTVTKDLTGLEDL